MALALLELTARVQKGAETLTGEGCGRTQTGVICDDKPTSTLPIDLDALR